MLQKLKNAIFRTTHCAIGARPHFFSEPTANSSVPPINLLQLEDRVLYSAVPLDLPSEPITDIDPAMGLLEFTDAPFESLTAADLMLPFSEEVEYLAANEPSHKFELIIVDTAVDDYELLVGGIVSNSDREFEVIYLNQEQDGIEQITELLLQHSNLDAIHLVSHGSAGAVRSEELSRLSSL